MYSKRRKAKNRGMKTPLTIPMKRSFTLTDRHGEKWDLGVQLSDRERIKEETDIDLWGPDLKTNIAALGKPAVAGAVLWTVLEPQAAARGITTPDALFARFDGVMAARAIELIVDAVEAATHHLSN
jgi:hypothetical protein